jgi:hypothetical protein
VGRIDTQEQCGALLSELRRIDKEVMQTKVPLSYAAELYSLRLHSAYVRDRIKSGGMTDTATENGRTERIIQEASAEPSQEAQTAAA